MANADDTLIQFGPVGPRGGPRPGRLCPVCLRRFSGEAAFCPYDGESLVAAQDSEPRHESLVGTIIDDRYEVLGILGEGGMGTVYEVRHVTLGRAFALKAMRRDLATEREVARRFIQEAKAAAAVSHPAVVQITDFGSLGTGEPYFVMEFLRGRALGRVIREQGAMDPTRAMAVLKQIAEALGAAHQAGVIHRDLKPDNIHLSDEDQVKVLDFGLAKVVGGSKLTRAGMVFGTPHYMSPEQAAGDPVDHRSDIYALGVVAYQMLTGRLPFEADTYMGVMTKHMYMSPPRPSEVILAGHELGALEDVVIRCLAKNPADRFQHMADLVIGFDSITYQASDGFAGLKPARPIAAKPRSLLESDAGIEPERVPFSRPRPMALGIALGTGALTMAAIVWAVAHQRAEEVEGVPPQPAASSVNPAPRVEVPRNKKAEPATSSLRPPHTAQTGAFPRRVASRKPSSPSAAPPRPLALPSEIVDPWGKK